MVTIFLDMDGVLCDFKTSYKKHFLSDEFDRDSFDKFVEINGFQLLDNMPNAIRLLQEVQSLQYENNNINVEILSSIGNSPYIDKVCEQKRNWLDSRGIQWKANFVQHKGLKKFFATPNSILIDDTKQNIYDFNEHTGVGIYYKDNNFDQCIDKLYEALYHKGLVNNYRFYGE